jgi:hypothetical protein
MDNSLLYANLRELAQDTFPKRCNNCGIVYESSDGFVQFTQNVRPSISGLKQGYDDDGNAIIELFRNCACGSTLMDVFYTRRDISQSGIKKRKDFDQLLQQLVRSGVKAERARLEISKWLRGHDNELMRLIDLGNL